MFISATSRRNDSPSFEEIDLLWITAGLGCDGDTIPLTAATPPTLEEILLGPLTGIPKINFHSPFLSYENGADLLRRFHFAAENRPSVGGICIGCTLPEFPDKFVRFMNQPPGSILSTTAVMTYGKTIRALRNFRHGSLNKNRNGASQRFFRLEIAGHN
ncbi:MAG TPA: hypothetical protein VFD87_08270 [Phototrophicaceae bacterium]|nr:hypothetical protein [Phototrophicaceae bacterium]